MRVIKIIKRDSELVRRRPKPTTGEILMLQQRDEADENRDVTKAVNNWIIERRENSKAEGIYSNKQLVDWHVDGSAEPAG